MKNTFEINPKFEIGETLFYSEDNEIKQGKVAMLSGCFFIGKNINGLPTTVHTPEFDTYYIMPEGQENLTVQVKSFRAGRTKEEVLANMAEYEKKYKDFDQV